MSGQNGAALVCALMITALLGTLGGALVVLVATETLISAHHRDALEALYAADGGIERAIGDLQTLSDWQSVPGTAAGAAPTDFRDGATAPRLADGTMLDLARLTLERQADSNAGYPAGSDRPNWRLFAHAPIDRLMPAGVIRSPTYVVLWIADDVDDGDGDPLRDSNGVLVVHAEAFGLRGVRRRIEATLAHEGRAGGADSDPEGDESVHRTEVRMICWREVP
jgi:type IV pilus assembly PilX-like protein